jgi:hypothetical protein
MLCKKKNKMKEMRVGVMMDARIPRVALPKTFMKASDVIHYKKSRQPKN